MHHTMQLQALGSLYFTINGNYFQAIGTSSMPDGDCIDDILNLVTREKHKVSRYYTMRQPITWLQRKDVEHLNPIS